MDPRQPPQHPFSRNTASPYARNPYPPTSQPPNYPPASHAPTNAASYPDHQRRPSDPHYSSYAQRSYAGEGAPLSGHSRHQSASSVSHTTPVNRGMPPPSSPQQGNSQHSYGMPPRASAAPGGHSMFSSSRELPALPPTRPGMSISDILGGPSPAREQPSGHYGLPASTAAPQSSIFAGSTHASPRMTAAPDYAPFRRPHTPEHQRMYVFGF